MHVFYRVDDDKNQDGAWSGSYKMKVDSDFRAIPGWLAQTLRGKVIGIRGTKEGKLILWKNAPRIWPWGREKK